MKLFKNMLAVVCCTGTFMAVGAIAADSNTAVSTLKPIISETSDAESLAFDLKPVNSFKANFHQKVVDDSGEMVEEYKGQVSVKQPGKLHWRSAKPYAQTLVTDSKKIWFYDEDLKQVTVKKVSGSLMQTPALILSGNTATLQKSFSIKAMKKVGDKKNYQLKPLKKNSMFESLNLILDKGRISQLIIHDGLDQVTTISLSNFQENVSLKNSMFTFKAPKGVKVVNEK